MRGGWKMCPAAIRAGADLVIDGGELPGTPSTVIDLREYEAGRWSIVRVGAVSESVESRTSHTPPDRVASSVMRSSFASRGGAARSPARAGTRLATFGGTGVQGDSVNYVAIPFWGGSTIQAIDDGEVNRWRNFQRVYGVPVAAYDGSSTTGAVRGRADARALRGLERLPAETHAG